MSDVADTLTAFREELIAALLVRRPSETTPAGAPPCHVMPIDGAPAPGEREGIEDDAELTVSLFAGVTLGEGTGYDAAIRRRSVVDVRYRARDNAALRRAMALDASIVTRLIRPETNYGYGFDLGTAAPVFVHEAAVWAGWSLIASSRDTGFDAVSKVLVEVSPG